MTTKRVRMPVLAGYQAVEGGYLLHQEQKIYNCFVERNPQGGYDVCKRQGLINYTSAFSVTGSAQGIAWFNNSIHVVWGDTIYHGSGGSAIIASGTAWTQRVASPVWGLQDSERYITFKDKFWRIGGKWTLGGVTNPAIYSSTDGENWQVANSAPIFGSRYGFGLVVFSGKMWVFGGLNSAGTKLRDVWSSENGIDWTLATGAAAWPARSYFGYIATNDGIYLAGGVNDATNNFGDVWFTNDGVNWNQLVTDTDAAPIYRRAYFDMLFFDNKLWIIAGWRNNGGVAAYLNHVCYSSDGINWTQSTAAAFATARRMAACVVYDKKMWHLGGADLATGALADVYSSTDGATWSLVTAAPGWGARYNHDAVVFKLPASVSSDRRETMWIFDGQAGAGTPTTIYSATLNVTTPSSEALSVTTANERMRFAMTNNGQYLVFKNLHDLWVYGGNYVKKVNSPNLPKQMADGIAVLDDYVFVLDKQGVVYNSKLANPYEWNSLDYLTAEYAQDEGRYITRYLNYIAVFKQNTIQFFQDVGNPLGSPLAPMLNNTIEIGVEDTNSIAHGDSSIFFVGRTGGGLQVYMLNGFQVKKVSTPAVDRALTSYYGTISKLNGMTFKSRGHSFYMINIADNSPYVVGVAYVYDITMDMWYLWGSAGYGDMNVLDCVPGVNFFVGNSINIFLALTSGFVYSLDENTVNCSEAGYGLGSITMQINLPTHDFGTRKRKFIHRAELVSDRQLTPTITRINWDTTAGTSGVLQTGTIDESKEQPAIWRLGSGRTFDFIVSEGSDLPIRWSALELDIEEGDG